MHLMVNARKSVSACQMNREIGGSYMTSWRLMHKIRGAMREQNADIKFFKLIKEINKNYAGNNRKAETTESGEQTYSPRGERHEEGSAVAFIKFTEKYIGNSDKHLGRVLPSLGNETRYGVPLSEILINGTKYTRSHVKIKDMRIFWNLMQRGITGQFHNISMKYLINYISEFTWRFNNRENENIFFDLLERTILVPI